MCGYCKVRKCKKFLILLKNDGADEIGRSCVGCCGRLLVVIVSMGNGTLYSW